MSLLKNQRASSLFLSLLVGLLSVLVFNSPFGARVEFFFHDLAYSVRGTRTPPQDIAVVAMDELSYRNLGVPLNQPWPRALHAKLLEKLAQYGARRVVFDVLFLDRGADPVADDAMASALKKIPTVLGVESVVQQVGGSGGSYALEELLEPYAPFKKAAEKLALVSLPDDGGYIRHFLTQRTERTATLLSLAEGGAEITEMHSLYPRPYDLINYYGPARSIQTLSYYQILEEEIPFDRKLVEGKTIYVGLSLRTDVGPAQKDVFKSPFGGSATFGVEIHATAAANLEDRSWIHRMSPALEAIAVGVMAVFGSVILLALTPVMGAISVAGGALLWTTAAYFLFTAHLMIPGALLVYIVFPIVFLCSTFKSFILTRKSELKLRSAFELYVSPEMVSQLHQGDSEVKLGGQKVWATALFTDIERFTDISEDLAPEKVAEMLNAYFSVLMDVIFKNKGTLIKFIGDSVFVIWGAPVHMDNHAELAVKAAGELLESVEKFNALKNFPELKTRIGIHTGPMVVGNLGSSRRFDYTAIGDAVNLASRIESLNKHFGTSILFSDAVRKDSGIGNAAIPLGDIRVKGKKDSVSLFTHFNSAPPPLLSKTLDQALRAFQRAQFDDAVVLFKEAGEMDVRLKKVAAFYENYIQTSRLVGDSTGWNGEIILDEK